MILVRITMKVLPEKQKELMQTLLSMVELPSKESGYLSHGIFCNIEDKTIFNMISEWETRQQLNRHLRSGRFSVLLGTKSLLREPMKIRIFTVMDAEGTEAVDAI